MPGSDGHENSKILKKSQLGVDCGRCRQTTELLPLGQRMEFSAIELSFYADAVLKRSCGLSSPVVGSHSVGRFTSRRFCRVCLGTEEFLRPQGPKPSGFYPPRGVGFIAWRLRRPKNGNTDGIEGIFGLAGRVWALALRPDPL